MTVSVAGCVNVIVIGRDVPSKAVFDIVGFSIAFINPLGGFFSIYSKKVSATYENLFSTLSSFFVHLIYFIPFVAAGIGFTLKY